MSFFQRLLQQELYGTQKKSLFCSAHVSAVLLWAWKHTHQSYVIFSTFGGAMLYSEGMFPLLSDLN